jgi:hypothetical protein
LSDGLSCRACIRLQNRRHFAQGRAIDRLDIKETGPSKNSLRKLAGEVGLFDSPPIIALDTPNDGKTRDSVANTANQAENWPYT